MVTTGCEEIARDLVQRLLARVVRSNVYPIGTFVCLLRIRLIANYLRRDRRTAALRVDVLALPYR